MTQEAAVAEQTGPSETRRLIYAGERLREIAFPLGGIGTGTISLGGRGNLQDFEIANRPAKGQPPLRNFFAVSVDDGSSVPNARILERQLFPPFTGYRGIPLHLVPGLPRFPDATFTGEYPLARVALSDPGFPLRATLEAFNPMIPGNVEDSGLPVAYFLWTLENTGRKPLTGQLVATIANLVGYPLRPWQGDPEWDGGAPRNRPIEEANFEGVLLGSERDGGRHPMAGTMALATTWQDVAILSQWERQDWIMSLRPFWYQVLGELPFDESVRPGIDRAAEYHRAQAALAARFALDPGESVTIPILIAWHFANRILPPGERQGKADGWVGNQYATRFPDAAAVVRYAVAERERLESQTRAFHDHLYATTLPDAVVDAVGANLQVMRSQTCFITASGRFYGYEGVNPNQGCCFGTCTHVWMYEQALAHLYPQLERNIREHAFLVETEPDGRMYFRSRLLNLTKPQNQVSHPATDGQLAEVIQVLRDYRLSNDRAFLEKLWPQAKRALEYAWRPGGWDADRDGVLEGTQHNTTDIEFYGPNPLCTVLYVAALRASAIMARELGDETTAATYESLAERGARRAEEILWNGEYYVQRLDLASDAPPNPFNQMGDGCLTDQLFGQWLAHTTGFERFLDGDRIRSALRAIHRHNFRRMADVPTNFMRAYAVNDERGLLYANFPAAPGEILPLTAVFRAVEVWTGCEYQAACHMIWEGLLEEGQEIVEAIRQRHDGTARNPWNEMECGDHYARAMASYGLLQAYARSTFDLTRGRLTLAPHQGAQTLVERAGAGSSSVTGSASAPASRDRYSTFFAVDGAWGSLHLDAETLTVDLGGGRLELRELEVNGRAIPLPAPLTATPDLPLEVPLNP